MNRAIKFLLLFLFVASLAPAQQPPPVVATTHLKVSDVAPDFTLPDQTGMAVKLSDFRGKKNVVLAFYVLAFTGGWTKELQAYQSDIAKLEENDSVVLGISVDSRFANKKFADEIGVKFQLLSDFTRKVSKEYGILDDERQFARRTTFVVDKEGKIQHIEAGGGAIDPTGAIQMCSMLKKKEAK